MVQVDSHYYGGLVVAPLNIVLYNVFSDHGPELYGKQGPALLTHWEMWDVVVILQV